MRLGGSSKLPDKPEALILYEQTRELGIPLVDGGLDDQPHIWMEMYAVCANRMKLWDMIEKRSQPPPPGGTPNG